MKKLITTLFVAFVAASAALVSPTPAQAAQFYDYPFLPYETEIGKNRTYYSSGGWNGQPTFLQRYDTYVTLDRPVPGNCRLIFHFVSTSGWEYHRKVTAWGAQDVYQPLDSYGPARLAIRIECWVTANNGWTNVRPEDECPPGSSCSPFYNLGAWSWSESAGGCGGSGNYCARKVASRSTSSAHRPQ